MRDQQDQRCRCRHCVEQGMIVDQLCSTKDAGIEMKAKARKQNEELKPVRASVLLVRNCAGCGLLHSIQCSMEPIIFYEAEALTNMFMGAMTTLSKAVCPQCEKLAPTVYSYRSLIGDDL